MTLQLQHRDDPYHQALAGAFHDQRAKVCDLMSTINEHVGHGGGDLEEDLHCAQIVEQMGRHLRRALERWQQGQYREAMRELSWALAKGGE